MFGHILNPHLSAGNVLLEGERGREERLASLSGPFRGKGALGTQLEKDGMDERKEREIISLVRGPFGRREAKGGQEGGCDTTHRWVPELDNRLPHLRMTERNAHEQDTLP